MVKNLPAMQTWVRSLGQEDPLEGGMGNPLQYSSLKNHDGQRSLVGYSPWGGGGEGGVTQSRTQLKD